MYIFKVKSPKASKSKWDILESVGVLTGAEAFRPVAQGGCAMAEHATGN
jgi:branched-chain amino acid transport system substrate-binding protein